MSSKVSAVSTPLIGERVGRCVIGVETAELSAARSVAPGGTALLAENAESSDTDLAADHNFCTSCGWLHQERERPVRCLLCRRQWTGNFHAICDHCEAHR